MFATGAEQLGESAFLQRVTAKTQRSSTDLFREVVQCESHWLRHTAVTNVYRASRDLFLAQRFARHVSPLTTVVYTNPSDEELFEGIRGLGC